MANRGNDSEWVFAGDEEEAFDIRHFRDESITEEVREWDSLFCAQLAS